MPIISNPGVYPAGRAETIVPLVINAAWDQGLAIKTDYGNKIAAATGGFLDGLSSPHIAAGTIAPPTITEPVVNIPTDIDVSNLLDTFGTKYIELVQLLSDKFSAFRTSYFPDEGAAYNAVENWLEAHLSGDVVSTQTADAGTVAQADVSGSELAQIWTDDQARIVSDKIRAQDAAVAQFAARRFPLPPDVAAAVTLQIEQKAQDALAESSRKAALAQIEVAKFNTTTKADIDKFNVGTELDADKFNAQIALDADKFNAQAQQFSAEKLLSLRQLAMDSTVKYISALASGPEIASRVVGIGYDAQSKLISSVSSFYGARTQAQEVISKVAQYNNSTALEAAVKNQAADLTLVEDKLKALLAEAQALAQMATSLFNNVHVSAGVSAGVSNSVSYSASTDQTSGTPGWPGWA